MKGLIAIAIIYLLTVGVCAIIKILGKKYGANNNGGEKSPPKIYYITKTRRKKETPSVIPIKASVIEKEDLVDYP